MSLKLEAGPIFVSLGRKVLPLRVVGRELDNAPGVIGCTLGSSPVKFGSLRFEFKGPSNPGDGVGELFDRFPIVKLLEGVTIIIFLSWRLS